MKAKKKLTLIDILFLWVNYALCLALLISYLAPVTDPRKFWMIAFFGLAYPPLLLTNTVLIVYWLLRKKWYFLLSAITIFCGLGVLNNNIGFHVGNSAIEKAQSEQIRLMTYNVHNFKKFGANKDISTKHEILELIKQQHPDIVGFQEFYTRKKGQYAMLDSLKQIMQTDNYYLEAFSSNQDEDIGMAIFSKYPIINKGFIRLSGESGSGNQCLYIDVKKDTQTFRLYSIHLQSIQFEPQDYKYLDTVKNGLTNMRSISRLGGKLKRAFLKRAEQVVKIRANAAQCPYPYIISGDFNDTPTSFAVNQMAKGLKNAFREKGKGLGRTYNGSFPNYQIDYIMAVPRFNVMSYHIIEKKLSDHYPVVSDLLLR
ncbi:MAG TPA: endonuclease/exonuclease/phosphatase family protein [Mucilaginibacter sp.]